MLDTQYILVVRRLSIVCPATQQNILGNMTGVLQLLTAQQTG